MQAPLTEAHPAEQAYPPTGQAWRMVLVLTTLYALSLLDRQVMALLLDAIRKDLRISDFQVSLLQGLSFALFYVVFGLLFGRAVDRLPRRGVVVTGVSLWSIAAAACGLARTFGQLAFARFGVGAGEAALAPSAYSMIADSFPKHRLALAMAVFGVGATLGTALSNAMGGLIIHIMPAAGLNFPLLGHLAPWRSVFVLVGVPGLLFAWLAMTFPEPARRGSLGGVKPIGETFAFMKSRRRFFVGHFFGFGLQSMCAYSLISWQAMFLHRHFGWSIPAVAGVLAMMNITVALTGQTFTGHIADRWFQTGRKDAYLRLFILSGAIQPFLILGAVAAPNIFVAFGFFVCWGMIANCTGPGAAAIQLVTPNEFRGQISAAYILVFNLLGVGFGSAIVGALTTYVFKNDGMVGWSILTSFVVFMPISIAFMVSALKPMREAVTAAEA